MKEKILVFALSLPLLFIAPGKDFKAIPEPMESSPSRSTGRKTK